MSSDDLLIMQALTGPNADVLTKSETNEVLEFLFQLRSGGELTGTQRERLRAVASKAIDRSHEAS